MRQRRFEGLLVADARERGAVGRLGALLGRILLTQQKRIHLQGAGEIVHRRLDGERADGRARRAVGRHLRPVRHDVVADGVHVGEVVGRNGAADGAADRRAREGARLQPHGRLQGGYLAVLGGADLDGARRARGRARGAKHVLAVHDDLDRAPGLARQHHGQRLQIDDGLAAEAAADLGGYRAHLTELQAGQLGRHVADHEVALAAAPDGGVAVLADADEAGVGLDVSLMHGLGLEAALDDDVGSRKPGVTVAQLVLEGARDVRCRRRARLGGGVTHVLVQDGRARLQRLVDIDDPGQDLVVDLDQLESCRGDACRRGRDRRHRVAGVQRLLARHHVAADVAHVLDAEGDRLVPRKLRQIAAGHDGLDARQGRGLRRVDRSDERVRMRTAQDLADQHAGLGGVSREGRSTGHLVLAIRAIGALADPLVVRTV